MPLSRVLEMCYTKVSRKTEILMHDLTVDLSLNGFNSQLLPTEYVPPLKIVSEPSEEENLSLMPNIPEMDIHDLKTNFKCTRHFIKLSCMHFHIEDKSTKSQLIIEA